MGMALSRSTTNQVRRYLPREGGREGGRHASCHARISKQTGRHTRPGGPASRPALLSWPRLVPAPHLLSWLGGRHRVCLDTSEWWRRFARKTRALQFLLQERTGRAGPMPHHAALREWGRERSSKREFSPFSKREFSPFSKREWGRERDQRRITPHWMAGPEARCARISNKDNYMIYKGGGARPTAAGRGGVRTSAVGYPSRIPGCPRERERERIGFLSVSGGKRQTDRQSDRQTADKQRESERE